MFDNEEFASFWGHLETFRKTLLRILFIIVSSILLCFIFYQPIFTTLSRPLTTLEPANEERLESFRIQNTQTTAKIITLPEKSILSTDLSHQITPLNNGSYSIAPGGSLVYAKIKNPELVVLSPLEGMMIALKTSFWIGTFLSSPLWLLVLAKFFLPGLHFSEKKMIFSFILTSVVFVLMGCLFAYFVTIPIANQYLFTFNQSMGSNLWSVGNYLDYTLFLLIANGIAFECGVLGIFAVRLNILTAETLAANRRMAILGAFIVAALLTPPDVLTQFMLAIPLIALYEAVIVYARLKGKGCSQAVSAWFE